MASGSASMSRAQCDLANELVVGPYAAGDRDPNRPPARQAETDNTMAVGRSWQFVVYPGVISALFCATRKSMDSVQASLLPIRRASLPQQVLSGVICFEPGWSHISSQAFQILGHGIYVRPTHTLPLKHHSYCVMLTKSDVLFCGFQQVILIATTPSRDLSTARHISCCTWLSRR
jgi:hypothetical protein